MRAESRIALVLVVCLLGGLGFFVQQRLKSETNEISDESLAQFLDAEELNADDNADATLSDSTTAAAPTSPSPAPPAQVDEPPRDLFAVVELDTPEVTARSTQTGSSAVSPNPWSRTSSQPTGAPETHPLSSRTQSWASTDVTQVSATEVPAESSTDNPFAGAPHRDDAAAASIAPREFSPRNLIVEDDAPETTPVFLPTETTSPTGNGSAATEIDPFANSSPFARTSAAPQSPVETADVSSPPQTAQRTTEPVFFQAPAPPSDASGSTQPMSDTPPSPFNTPSASTPAADPFAPAPTSPAAQANNPQAGSASTPTFNFSTPQATTPPSTTQSPFPAQSTPAPNLTPTPSANPFGNPSTTQSSSPPAAYNPQGLSNAPGGDPGTKIYQVQPGDNYWTISRKVYGAGRFFSALAEYNKPRIEDPELLAPGMIVLIPTTDVLHARYDEIISGPSPNETIEPAGFFVDASGAPMYRVGEADTLSDIAQRYLGRSSRWIQIYGMNQDVIENADALRPGIVLALPPDAAPIALAPEESVVR